MAPRTDKYPCGSISGQPHLPLGHRQPCLGEEAFGRRRRRRAAQVPRSDVADHREVLLAFGPPLKKGRCRRQADRARGTGSIPS